MADFDTEAWGRDFERIRKGREEKRRREAEEKARIRAEREAAARAAMSTSDKQRERGAKDMAGGMKLLTEAGRRRTVEVDNPLYDSVRGYTDSMGAGEQVGRRGLFRAEQPPVQVVVQSPGAQAPPPPVSQPAPTAPVPAPAPTAQVPAGAAPGFVPGELPAPALDESVPLEIDQMAQEAAAEGALYDMAPDVVTAAEPPPGPMAPSGGILQRQMDAGEAAAAARVQVANAEADALEDASLRAQEALDDAATAKADQDARLNAALEASEAATTEVARLTKVAQEAQAIDPKRAWANAGIGRKILFVISALGYGAARRGPEASMSAITRYIDQDIEAQRQDAAKAMRDVEGARSVAQDQQNMLVQTRSVIADEQAATDMVRVARLEQVKAQLQSEIARAGVGQVTAEQEGLLTALEEQIAQKTAAVQARAATNAETITKSVSVYSPGQRRAMNLAGEGLIKGSLKASELAEAQEGKIELARLDQMAKGAERAEKAGDKVAQQAYQFGRDTAAAQQTVGLIDSVIGQDDIAGYGFTAGPSLTQDQKATDEDLKAIAESLGRLQSQGVISTTEEDRFNDMITSGTGWGGEERLRRNLERIRAMVQLKINAHERGISREARDYYNRNVASADFDARWTGGGDAPVVQED